MCAMESDKDYQEVARSSKRKPKRAKRTALHSPSALVSTDDLHALSLKQATSFVRSVDAFRESSIPEQESDPAAFEIVISPFIEEFLRCRHQRDGAQAIQNDHGHLVRPISSAEGHWLAWNLAQKQGSGISTRAENILLRRLTYQCLHRIEPIVTSSHAHVTEPFPSVVEPQLAPPDVLEALYAINTTPLDRSFVSRLHGYPLSPTTIFFQDWGSMTPWMELMADVMDHHRLLHRLRDPTFVYSWSSITYTPLYAWHLPQIHDLLERTFWPGIDVSDSVKWEPEQCTIVASYKKLVVGCAFLSETLEPYVTYIAVRTGWEGVGIATFMLYHLIRQNPNQDISLHVSATNSAMLLYNQFGFKAEEFVVGFYEDYLGDETKLCRNALRMRYRR